jgi:dienelactone hydrolase
MHIEDIPYTVNGESMLGHLAFDDHRAGLKPAILVSHEGPGLDGHAKAIAEKLAGMGYTAFALDYHGNGEPPPMDQAMERIGAFRDDPDRACALALAGLDVLLAQPSTDPHRVAAIGYCYGGLLSLELARTGANVKAVVGFHPGFGPPRTEASRRIRARILMCCGTEDPFATRDQRAAFEVEMCEASVSDWSLELYGGVGHSFTNPAADMAGIPGVEYNAMAERRSWKSMLALLDEALGPV